MQYMIPAENNECYLLKLSWSYMTFLLFIYVLQIHVGSFNSSFAFILSNKSH